MKHLKPFPILAAAVCLILSAASCSVTPSGNSYEDFLSLFRTFDELRQPDTANGIPDYSARSMREQFDSLRLLQKRLVAMDTTGWNRDRQTDYRLLQAHMNGLEFNHRVMHRWSADPAFYSTIGWFNPTMEGAAYLPDLPMDERFLNRFRERLSAFPAILEQARINLTEMKPDLARLGIKRKEWELEHWKKWASGLQKHHPDLVDPAARTLEALESFKAWLEGKLPTLTGSSGIGVENYDWLLKNVYLSPYSWKECVDLTGRELERSLALLKMEEFRNRELPQLPLINDRKTFDSIHRSGQEWLIRFIRENRILPEPDYLRMKSSGGWGRPTGRNFFEHVLDRDPLPLLPHDMVGHSPDAAREEGWNSRPFPRAYDPFYVSGTRAEALATGMEELLMHMGMLDTLPRSRELTYMLRIFRAIRALADLRMHSNEFTLEQAMQFAMNTVPYGWYNQNTYLIWEEMDLYMRQPGYGAGYLMGSVQLEQLIARQAMKLGNRFDIRQFFREFFEPGLIPISLIEYNMD